ncbi:MAG: hypothetical protein KF789_03305 [Bdellovibrionaceae bacterium]|nr:hypothetical protein [Pseudobdellovibrionaceae bacterium]
MRFLVGLLFVTFAFGFASADDSIDFSKPPFWMPSYDEMRNLKPEQLDFYARGFEKIAQEFPALKGLKKTQVLEATEWVEGWTAMQTKLYRACQWEKHYQASCEKAADLRVNMLMLRGNKKAENRAAEEGRSPDETPDSDL